MGLLGLTTTDGARAGRRSRLRQSMCQLAIVGQAVGPRLHALEAGQVVEQRVARLRHEHVVARVARAA